MGVSLTQVYGSWQDVSIQHRHGSQSSSFVRFMPRCEHTSVDVGVSLAHL